jgi:single-strand DNA-binding protein
MAGTAVYTDVLSIDLTTGRIWSSVFLRIAIRVKTCIPGYKRLSTESAQEVITLLQRQNNKALGQTKNSINQSSHLLMLYAEISEQAHGRQGPKQQKTFMNALRNKVQLIGHLGMDPEIKALESGKKLAKVSIATNETYKNAKGERVTETQWHNLIAWGRTADIVEKFLKKGSEVAIEGKLINRNYTDKEGIKRYVTEVEVNELLMFDSKK